MTKKLDRSQLLENEHWRLIRLVDFPRARPATDAAIDRVVARIAKAAREVRDERKRQWKEWGLGLPDVED